MDKIILGYDFTENSESALNMALILAEKGNCALEIVWVDDTLDDTVQIAKETIRQRMDEMLRNIVSQNNQLLPNGRLVYSIAFGRVHDALIKKANFDENKIPKSSNIQIGALVTFALYKNGQNYIEYNIHGSCILCANASRYYP